MKKVFTLLFSIACLHGSKAQIIIAGFMANPPSTDSPYEYVQLIATQAINFSTNNYCVVWCNNGSATSSGWVAGGVLSYKFDLTSGSVAVGDVFYVGGSGKLINGSGSTDISGANWIRTINTGTTGGDGFGTAAAGVCGNGGSNADGIAVFSGTTILSTTVPVDAIFYGTGIGSAKPATGGYVLPTNDHYVNAQGTFGNGTNTFYITPDPGSGDYIKLSGTYNVLTSSWTTARTATVVASPTTLAQIATAIALPIELARFSAKKSPGGIALDWQTATETNNDFFEIERGTDGRTFSAIAKVEGAGNSLSTKNYQYLDEKPAAGTNYYRLKQTDFDGISSLSKVVAIDWQSGQPEISLAPDPESGSLILNISGFGNEEQAAVRLFDLTGRAVIVWQIDLSDGAENIDLRSGFQPGIHALSVVFSSGKQVGKLVAIH